MVHRQGAVSPTVDTIPKESDALRHLSMSPVPAGHGQSQSLPAVFPVRGDGNDPSPSF